MAFATSMNSGDTKQFLSKTRGIARSLISKTPEERAKMENELLTKLKKVGILQETAVLDNVLDLTIEDILERRLQTIVFRKGLARTVFQSRQLITHGHITIDNRRVTVPGYMVAKLDEPKVIYSPESAVANQAHPLRAGLSVVAKQPEIRQPTAEAEEAEEEAADSERQQQKKREMGNRPHLQLLQQHVDPHH